MRRSTNRIILGIDRRRATSYPWVNIDILELKNRIETIGTQINTRINQEIITKIENIAYQLRFMQTISGDHYEKCLIIKSVESPEKIAEKYKKVWEV